MTKEKTTHRIKGFDGLRALAVLMVWLGHKMNIDIAGPGVSLFFVLSGFLIIDILRKQRERIQNNGSTFAHEWKSFVVRRAYRIFPVYYIYLFSVVFPFAYLSNDNSFGIAAIISHIFYSVNIWIGFIYQKWNTVSSHLWSLSVEEQFYLIFPVAALSMRSKKLPFVCAATVSVGAAIYAYLILYEPIFAIDTFSLAAFGKIALGGLFVLLAAARSPLQGRASVLPATLLAIYIAIPFFINRYGSPSIIHLFQWVPMTLLIGAVLVLIQRNQSSRLVTVLEFPPIRLLGVISYGFYVYHYLFDTVFLGAVLQIDFKMLYPPFAIHLLDFIIPLTMAILSWRYIERPILQRRPAQGRLA